MYQYEDKINSFTDTIYKRVAKEKEYIIKRSQKHREKVLKDKELEFLEEAYNNIQKGLKEIDKEKNEMLSKAIMDGKKRVLKRREEIVNTVFENAKVKLRNFLKTDDYKDYLDKLIDKNINLIGEGDIEVFISREDEKLLNVLKDKYDSKVKINISEESILGGCIVINHTNNKYIDDTFHQKILELRDDYTKVIDLNI